MSEQGCRGHEWIDVTSTTSNKQEFICRWCGIKKPDRIGDKVRVDINPPDADTPPPNEVWNPDGPGEIPDERARPALEE